MKPYVRLAFLSTATIVLALPAAAQSSQHFSMKRVTIAGGVATMTSPSFSNSVSTVQESPIGASSTCNVGSHNNIGFWSVQGVAPVPIILTAKRNMVDPLDVDLLWSGSAPTFQLFRAYSPVDIFNPANLDRETNACSATDEFAFQSSKIFYNVIKKP